MKYVRINPKLISMKSAGGSPSLQIPTNIKGLKKLKEELSKIDFFLGEQLAYLVHKKINEDDIIPALSRRFIASMKFLFSNNKKRYETTYVDEDDNQLIFVYHISFAEISDAINKIEKLINFLEENLINDYEQTLKELFDKEKKEYWKDKIKEFKINNNITIFAITNIREILSKISYTYKKLWFPDTKINLVDEEESIIFVSSQNKNDAKKILIKNRVQILFEDDISLDVKGNFAGKLPGLIYSKKINKLNPLIKKHYDENHKFENAFYEKLTQKDFHSVNVGVIDGGIASNSIIFKDLASYHTNEEMFNEPNPEGTHAEEVSSILLFAKNITKINDELPRPRVHLFNVIDDKDKIHKIKIKIHKILELHAEKIKIWNLSIVLPGIKNSSIISDLGVFLDKMQEQHQVIFIVPTGNLEQGSATKTIEAPSGSCFALSVSATDSDSKMAPYSRMGYKKYISPKPDLVTFGGSENDPFPVIANNSIRHTWGTSLAVPLVTRKLSYLISEGLSIKEAVALLINYAHYFMYKKKIASNIFNGHGVLPIKANELRDFKNNKAIIIISLELKTDYKQGILDIVIPKTDNNRFDFSYFISINTDAVLERNETFEYVLDSARIVFGKVYKDNLQSWEANDRAMNKNNDMDLGEGGLESYLRTYKGKFKNRDTFKRETIKTTKTTFKEKGIEYNIKKWGIKITRNSLLQTGREKQLNVAITMIIESKSINDFLNKFIIENKNIIQNAHNIEFDENVEIKDEIKFV